MARPTPRLLLRQVLLTGLAAAMLALVPWHLGFWDRWEAKTWDMRAAWLARPGPASGDIVLIFVDQPSLDWAQEHSGLSWPWPREVYAAVLEFCRRGQPSSLALDVLFLEPSVYGVGDDLALAAAMEDFPRTALALMASHAPVAGRQSWPEDIPLPGPALQGLDPAKALAHFGPAVARVSLPVPELTLTAATLGNVQQQPDQDGVFRRMRPLEIFDGQVLPSLGLAAFLASRPDGHWRVADSRLTHEDRSIPLDRNGRALLRFRGPSGTHQAFSAAAVLQSELRLREGLDPLIAPAEFSDKHVFLGFSAPGLLDLRPTPMGGVYPGVEIQATFLDNFLSGDFLRDTPRPVVTGLTTVLCLLTALGLAWFRAPLTGAGLGAAMLAAPIILALLAYQAGYWLPVMVQEAGTAGAVILGLLYNYSTEGRQKRFIKSAFQQYLSPQVIEQLIAHPEKLKLGGERKTLSIFFSDLQGFTSISEGLDPETLTALLNDYLSAMTEIIHMEQGTVDKYEGDAIIAFWNAPLDVPDHAERAVRAALRCQSRLAELRPVFRQRAGHDLHMRIGINTGQAVVGNMGSHNRFDYSMLGDAVNLAARLEGVNKQFRTFTMVSQATRDAAGNGIPMRELGRVAVVGRKGPVTVFEPLHEEHARNRAADMERFDQGLRAYYRGDLVGAAEIFSSLAEDDPVAARYLDICRERPPVRGDEWDGVFRMMTKT